MSETRYTWVTTAPSWAMCVHCGATYQLGQFHNCGAWTSQPMSPSFWPVEIPATCVTVTTGVAALTEDDVRRIVREELERVLHRLAAGDGVE